jgi:hypothetical protein
MSAQETVALQDASTCVLMASITSNPRAELAFAPAAFSLLAPSSSSEPSHPCPPKSNKMLLVSNKRQHEVAVRLH